MTLLLCAFAVASGVPAPAVGVLFVAMEWPGLFLFGTGAWGLYSWSRRRTRRRQLAEHEAGFLRTWATEVAAGSSIRLGLASAAASHPELPAGAAARLARAGRSPAEISQALKPALAINGTAAAAFLEIANLTGARAAPVLTEMAVRAAERRDIADMRRAETAQVRLSAWLVGGVPLVLSAVLFATGRGPTGSGAALVISLVGAALIVLGALISIVLLQRGAE